MDTATLKIEKEDMEMLKALKEHGKSVKAKAEDAKNAFYEQVSNGSFSADTKMSGIFKSPYLREKGTFRKVHTSKYL